MFLAPRSRKTESPLPREEGVQNTQRMLLAKLFAQQAPAQLVTNEKKKSVKEEML